MFGSRPSSVRITKEEKENYFEELVTIAKGNELVSVAKLRTDICLLFVHDSTLTLEVEGDSLD